MAPYIRNQLGLRAVSRKCVFWVMMGMRQMETVTGQQKTHAAARHQAKADLEAGAVGSEGIRIGLG